MSAGPALQAGNLMKFAFSLAIYVAAGFAEIAGCFAFWAWLKLGRSILWSLPGILSLCLLAFLLTRIESETASRAYATYGGVYITASLIWMRIVEGRSPDRWELLDAGICLIGAALILFSPRATGGAI
jgi:small multidrug resistance family-3 protein